MIGCLSILKPIEDVHTWAHEGLHTTFGLTWAWSIVALTISVRMLLVPLTVRQIHSMQRMQQFLPEMKAIQKRYKNDRKKQNEELMKFYKEHQINPASSCLPILPQIPIFFALYFVLRGFDEEIYPLYPESDLGWLGFVPDITANITSDWSGYVLLAVYVASQVASTWFMPTQSKGQRVIFLILPFVFVFFIIDPPGGTGGANQDRHDGRRQRPRPRAGQPDAPSDRSGDARHQVSTRRRNPWMPTRRSTAVKARHAA